MTQDLHLVFAVTARGRAALLWPSASTSPGAPSARVRVSDPMPYNAAIDRWYALDDLRIAGRLPQTAFFVVRAADDPDWPAAGRLEPIYTLPAVEHRPRVSAADDERERRSLEAATRRAWKDRGGEPGTGGVFYRIGTSWDAPLYAKERYRQRRPYVARSMGELIDYVKRQGWIVPTATGWARILPAKQPAPTPTTTP